MPTLMANLVATVNDAATHDLVATPVLGGATPPSLGGAAPRKGRQKGLKSKPGVHRSWSRWCRLGPSGLGLGGDMSAHLDARRALGSLPRTALKMKSAPALNHQAAAQLRA